MLYLSQNRRVVTNRKGSNGKRRVALSFSGPLSRKTAYFAFFVLPEWQETQDVYGFCLKLVPLDPRVHVANIGMRWSEEVEKNVRLIEGFRPPLDVSKLPRMTAGIYRAQDAEVTDGA
jgi:hypothetical protein